MVCHKQKISECSGGAAVPACPPDQPCAVPDAPPQEPSCTEHELAECVPRYVLPCQQHSDCGEGFSCEASEECMCSGSAGAARDAGSPRPSADQNGFAPVPARDAGSDTPESHGDAAVGGVPPICECHPSEQKHCALQAKTCNADQDCPRDFACVTYTDAGSVSCAKSDAGDGCVPVETQPYEKRCEPRFRWATPGRVKGGDTPPGGPGYAQDGDESSAPRDDSGGVDAGNAAAGSSGSDEAAPDTGSCSVASPRAGALGSIAVPVGFVLVALGLRRRRTLR
jgi:hypothetical protein